ncbi:PrgI family protein [Candidatus Saccharibacteria bacterium]|nr:PrgI family protein [Candidatus Saccharibacteria bacterium]
MAQYKVPQDVEADDKLIGPFSFRQFIYLLIAAAFIAVAYGLFQLFPLLAIIPLPIVFFLLVLALPLRKEQPMETYIAALISFYTKPTKRFWNPGQRESTIEITAPKIVEEVRTRNLTSDDASRRLSFLANVVDSEGYSIKNGVQTPVRDEFVAEANTTLDMFDIYETQRLSSQIASNSDKQHAAAIKQMRDAIEAANRPLSAPEPAPEISPEPTLPPPDVSDSAPTPDFSVFSKTVTPINSEIEFKPIEEKKEKKPKDFNESSEIIITPKMKSLSNDKVLTVATIAKEAKRASRKADDQEVYISLH